MTYPQFPHYYYCRRYLSNKTAAKEMHPCVFSVNTRELNEAVSVVTQKAMPSNATLPILEGIYMYGQRMTLCS